jgi:hypothetical protein
MTPVRKFEVLGCALLVEDVYGAEGVAACVVPTVGMGDSIYNFSY